jgi:cytoskeletal protein RodZ
MSDTATVREDLEDHTDMPVGEILRRTRIYYGQSLEQVEAILRIRAIQLDAIEKGDISRLPGRVYAIGFVRAYSEYLGLNGDKMVHLFKVQSVGGRVKPELSMPAPASESKIPNLYAVLGGLIGAIMLISFWAAMHTSSGGQEPIPEIPVAMTSSAINKSLVPAAEAPSNDELASADDNGDEAAAADTPKSRIVITVKDSSWVEIKNLRGQAILRQVLKPGDQYMVPDEQGLVMATGNAGGLSITVDGKEAPPIGKPAQVKRNIMLTPEDLLKKPLE